MHALCRIDDKYRSLASSDRTGDFITEVHVPRSVDEVEGITLMLHLDGVRFDGYTALFLQIHVVQHLVLHLPHIDSLRDLQHAIRKGRFAVIDVSNNTKITYLIH